LWNSKKRLATLDLFGVEGVNIVWQILERFQVLLARAFGKGMLNTKHACRRSEKNKEKF
jgi:hypothetical protein